MNFLGVLLLNELDLLPNPEFLLMIPQVKCLKPAQQKFYSIVLLKIFKN